MWEEVRAAKGPQGLSRCSSGILHRLVEGQRGFPGCWTWWSVEKVGKLQLHRITEVYTALGNVNISEKTPGRLFDASTSEALSDCTAWRWLPQQLCTLGIDGKEKNKFREKHAMRYKTHSRSTAMGSS